MEIEEPIHAYDYFNREIMSRFFVTETNKRSHVELARGVGNYAILLDGWTDVTTAEMDKFWAFRLFSFSIFLVKKAEKTKTEKPKRKGQKSQNAETCRNTKPC